MVAACPCALAGRGPPWSQLVPFGFLQVDRLRGPVRHRQLVIPKRVLSGRGLFDDTGKVIGLAVVPADLLVRLAVRVGQAAVGQLR
jgi:hypothetical protein